MATFMASAGVKMYTAADNMMVFARSLTTISTFIRTVTNLSKTWQDDSKSLTEQITATAAAVGMLLPMVLRLGSSYLEMGKSLVVSRLAHEGATIAAAKETVANMGLAASIKAIGVSILEAMPYIALVAAAIMAVVAAVKIVSDNINK